MVFSAVAKIYDVPKWKFPFFKQVVSTVSGFQLCIANFIIKLHSQGMQMIFEKTSQEDGKFWNFKFLISDPRTLWLYLMCNLSICSEVSWTMHLPFLRSELQSAQHIWMAFIWLCPKSKSQTVKFQSLDYISHSWIKPKELNVSKNEKIKHSPTGFRDQSSKSKNQNSIENNLPLPGPKAFIVK